MKELRYVKFKYKVLAFASAPWTSFIDFKLSSASFFILSSISRLLVISVDCFLKRYNLKFANELILFVIDQFVLQVNNYSRQLDLILIGYFTIPLRSSNYHIHSM